MYVAKLRNTCVLDIGYIPRPLAPLFYGVWAHRTFAGTPHLFGDPDPNEPGYKGDELPAASKFFMIHSNNLTNTGTCESLVGGILVTDVEMTHRRACLHVSVLPEHQKGGHAKRALAIVGAVMGDSFGFERFWTYALNDTPGVRVATSMGLELEGTMVGHALTPEGRRDILILGGLWVHLRKHLAEELDQIEWGSPDGK